MLLFHPQFSKNNNYSKIIIRNSFRLFLLITIQLVVVSLITCGLVYKNDYFYFCACIFGPFALYGFFRQFAVAHGIVLDANTNSIKFPGGGIPANSIFDFLKPSFIFQAFLIKEYCLKDIEMVNFEKNPRKTKNGITYDYGVSIHGSFGSAYIEMESSQKAQQLYSNIINLNGMHVPISNYKNKN